MKLTTPLSIEDVKSLNVGQTVYLSGEIVTARDAAHKYLAQGGKAPTKLNVIYHCGPIVKDAKVVSAGPTTSAREEPYMADIIKEYGVRAIIGKGGMRSKTLKALEEHGCAYLAAVGGAGAVTAQKITKIKGVYMGEEFGPPEAFWVFEVIDLPLTCTMDAHGRSLYKDVQEKSKNNLKKILNSLKKQA